MKFHHVGIFVKSINQGLQHFANLLNYVVVGGVVEDHVIKVRIQFIRDDSGILYELIEPFGDDNPVSNSLRLRKNILNHLAYEVSNLDAEIERLRRQKYIPISLPTPAVAFQNRRVVFLLNPLGFIEELIESE